LDAFFPRLQIMMNKTIRAPMPAIMRIVTVLMMYSFYGFDRVL